MRTLYKIALELTVVAVVALAVQGCASIGAADPERASRNEAGQTALEGMENSVLKDDGSDTPVRAKPPN
jgi:hypothetical protein